MTRTRLLARKRVINATQLTTGGTNRVISGGDEREEGVEVVNRRGGG